MIFEKIEKVDFFNIFQKYWKNQGLLYLTRHQNPVKFVQKFEFWLFDSFSLLARFFKYDFWIPWQILDRPRWSKNISEIVFEVKIFSKKICFGKILKIFENFLKISKFYKDS